LCPRFSSRVYPDASSSSAVNASRRRHL
jgi:hypothetical protein